MAAVSQPPATVILDPGHGGMDGGAQANGVSEKQINLAIALDLKELLSAMGFRVIMTREDDRSIHDPQLTQVGRQKRSDLHNRLKLMQQNPQAIFVSIHQNSLPSSKQTHGAQVFYGKKEGSAEVANAVQLALNQTVNAGNEKTEKAIDASIFLMKNVTAPAILIECGFLSNENETALLKSGEYQQRLAVVIASGLLQQQ